MAPRIPVPSDVPGPLGIVDAGPLSPELTELRRQVYSRLDDMDRVDPVTREVVRMRNARHQGCRLCQGLRSKQAVDAGVTEELLQSARSEDKALLSEHQCAALALADLFLDDPSGMTPEIAERLRRSLTTEQVVELLIRLMHWSNNKTMISLGLDLDEIRPQLY